MKTLIFKIRGMDCAEEITALRKTVGPLAGVERLDFNLLNGTMTVRIDSREIGEDTIRSAVREAGLEALPFSAGESSTRETFWQKNGRTVMCIASGFFLVAGFLFHVLSRGGFLNALTAGESGRLSEFPAVTIILYLAALVSGGWYIFPKAWLAARRLRADMNLLMTIAAIGAIVIGQWFEAVVVTFLFALALLLESWGVGRARKAIRSLIDRAPLTARVISPTDGSVQEIPVATIGLDAVVQVRPGEKLPLDGIILTGATSINQAPITGESIPVSRQAGDEVFAGTINNEGSFTFRVTRAANDTTLARIIRMVEEAQARRARSELWVEKFARYYTPLMMIGAIALAVLPPLIWGGGWIHWFYRGLVLLVIACPCALVISTPVSFVAALAAAARAGVLVKGGIHLESVSRLRAVALDKTGTLTFGRPEVRQVLPLNGHTFFELLATAAGLESLSEHPLARAVLRRTEQNHVKPRVPTDFKAIPGKGAEARMDGKLYWIGSHSLMHDWGEETPEIHELAEAMEDAGHSVVALGNEQHVCGLISVADTIRPHAGQAVQALRQLGLENISLLTGDNEGTARAIAREAGIEDVLYELLPEGKIHAVTHLIERFQYVAMIGDGINDAPALAAATVGIAMGAAGSDAAVETADIALTSDDLMKVPWLVGHSRRTVRIVRQNIFFALGIKFVFMALAVAGLATLWMAIAADMGASLLVISNGLRLLRTDAR